MKEMDLEALMRLAFEDVKMHGYERIKTFRKLERINGVIAGVLIGTGAGGWVALGMEPLNALAFVLVGGSFALGGAKEVHNRQRYELYRNWILKKDSEAQSSKE